MSVTKCPTLQNFFEVKNALTEKGLVYVKSSEHPPVSGVNYIKQDGYLFTTCSLLDYIRFNNEDDEAK